MKGCTGKSSQRRGGVSTRAKAQTDFSAFYYNSGMEQPAFVIYLSAGAYIGIMLAVLGWLNCCPATLTSRLAVWNARKTKPMRNAGTKKPWPQRLAVKSGRKSAAVKTQKRLSAATTNY